MAERCFTRMGQIGIAVKDIDKAAEVCKKYGMGPMRTFITNEKSVQAGVLYGKDVDSIRFRTLMYEMDGVTFELLQPLENTIWSDFIKEHGEGVCDIMFTPTPRYYEVLKERDVKESMSFRLYNHTFPDGSRFEQMMRMHDTRKDLGFSIFSFDQTEETKKRKYPEDNIATGAYKLLETGNEYYLQTPKYIRIEKILVVVDNLKETIENYKAYGFVSFAEIQECDGNSLKASFFQNTDGAGVTFEIIEPMDEFSAYGKFLKKSGRGVYNVILEQNPEYNNVIKTLTSEK